MRVLFLDTKPFNPNRYIARGVYEALRACVGVDCVWAEYRTVAALAAAGDVDLFLAFGGEEADNAAVHQAAALAGRSVIWFTEDPYEAVKNQALARHFDVVFSNDAASAMQYGAAGRHLPLAADPQRNFFPITAASRPFDVFFAGTAWPNRVLFLEELRKRRPQLRYRTLLVGNDALAKHLAPHLSAHTRRLQLSAGVPIREFCRLASLSQLTLTLPRKFATGALRDDAASDTPGPRFFEVALAGSCQLVDAQTTPVAGRVLEAGREFIGFETIDDCIDAIDTLLADPDRTLAIAAAAQARVLREHTYAQRVAALLAEVRSLPPRPSVAEPITLRTTPRAARPRVLLVTHNLSSFGGFGGAEVYLDRLRTHAQDAELFVLVPDRRAAHAGRYAVFDRALNEIDAFDVEVPYARSLLIHPPLESAFQKLLVRHAIDVVHFNHLLAFPPSLPIHAKAVGCATVLTQHDHYLLCDSFTLTDAAGRYCQVDRRGRAACDGCLAQSQGIVPGSQDRRSRYLRQVLAAVDRVLVGSEAARTLLLRFYPELAPRCRQVTPPMEPLAVSRMAADPAAPLRVVHLGNFTRFKGADTVLAAVAACRDLPIEFHIHGRIDGELVPEVQRLAGPQLHVHGGYASGALPPSLAQADVLLFLSRWPETYGITLSEGQALGLVPIVTSIGAPAERVRDGVDGFVVAPDDSAAVVAHLTALARDRARLAKMRANLPAAPGVSPAAFAAGVQAIWREVAAPFPFARCATQPTRTLSFEELGLFLTQPTWTQVELDPGHRRLLAAPDRRQLRFYVRRFIEVQREQGLRSAWTLARRRIGVALQAATR
jgi:glycosyltransferase involved in cell wall biosynthesis/spore maturation protein CgeB